MKPTVLVVEDSEDIQKLYLEYLGSYAELLQAFDQESARQMFVDKQQLIVCVIVDGNVPIAVDGLMSETTRSTCDLVRFIRDSGFTGLVIAASGEPNMETAMVDAGCNEFHYKNERGLLGNLAEAIKKVS